MITRDDITAAVADGLLTEQQASALITRAESRKGTADSDDERFRFLNGFNDVFLALGIVLVAAAFAVFASIAGSGGMVAIAAAGLAIMWVLAEVVIRWYRAVLPAIVISIVIHLFAYLLLTEILPANAAMRGLARLWSPINLTAALSLLAFALVFYWRFRLPFTLGTIAMLVYGCAVAAVVQFAGMNAATAWSLPVTLASGLAIFSVAVAYDISDPDRVSRRSDCAFWLHMSAAPMITHGLMGVLMYQARSTPTVTMMLGFVALAIVSLALDRRAPLVSALLYLGISIGYVFTAMKLQAALATGSTLLFTGTVVVTMGLAWRPLRRLLLTPFSRFAFVRKLPPLRTA